MIFCPVQVWRNHKTFDEDLKNGLVNIILKIEPTNPADNEAIIVLSEKCYTFEEEIYNDGSFLGYIPRNEISRKHLFNYIKSTDQPIYANLLKRDNVTCFLLPRPIQKIVLLEELNAKTKALRKFHASALGKITSNKEESETFIRKAEQHKYDLDIFESYKEFIENTNF